MCDVPSIAVFCSESIECFPGIAFKFFLQLLVTMPVAPISTGIIVHFRFHMRCISIHNSCILPLLLLLLLLLLLGGSKYCLTLFKNVALRVPNRNFGEFIVDFNSRNFPSTRFTSAANAIGSDIGIFN
jgi:hypothetical protein